MQRFNIALLPTETAAQAAFVDLAQTYFGQTQDGYILGENGRPHVTACQFYAESERQAVEAFKALSASPPAEVIVEEFYVQPGAAEHEGKFWAAFLVSSTPELVRYQGECHRHLSELGLETLTLVESYSPHFTLARLPSKPAQVPSDMNLPQKKISVYPAVGLSTENGVFVRELPV